MRRRSSSYSLPRERRQSVGQVALYTEPRQKWTFRLVLLLIIAVGLALAASIPLGPRISLPSLGASAPPPPRTSHLGATGVRQGGAFESGSDIVLSWRSARPADRYRVQITLLRTGGSANSAARATQRIVASASYRFNPSVPGQYQWRVQSYLDKRWGAYSRVASFAVLPAIARPAPLMPRNGSRAANPVRLCWSGVKGASGYELWIAGRAPLAVGRTCIQLDLSPGRHTWRVAAFVHGVHSFTGKYSPVAHFAVGAQQAVALSRPASRPIRKPTPAPSPRGSAPASRVPARQQPAAPGPAQSQPSASAPQPSRATAPSRSPAPRPVVPAPAPPPAAPARAAPGAKQPSSCIPMFTC